MTKTALFALCIIFVAGATAFAADNTPTGGIGPAKTTLVHMVDNPVGGEVLAPQKTHGPSDKMSPVPYSSAEAPTPKKPCPTCPKDK